MPSSLTPQQCALAGNDILDVSCHLLPSPSSKSRRRATGSSAPTCPFLLLTSLLLSRISATPASQRVSTRVSSSSSSSSCACVCGACSPGGRSEEKRRRLLHTSPTETCAPRRTYLLCNTTLCTRSESIGVEASVLLFDVRTWPRDPKGSDASLSPAFHSSRLVQRSAAAGSSALLPIPAGALQPPLASFCHPSRFKNPRQRIPPSSAVSKSFVSSTPRQQPPVLEYTST